MHAYYFAYYYACLTGLLFFLHIDPIVHNVHIYTYIVSCRSESPSESPSERRSESPSESPSEWVGIM